MARKAKEPTIGRTCNSCGKVFKFDSAKFSPAEQANEMVNHYKAKHPDRMAFCFDQYGQTWNAQYDAAIKALHETSRQRDVAVKQRDETAGLQRSLAAKLNAIVLVLRND